MKRLLLIITASVLTGCGTYGEPLWLAAIYNSNDPCQTGKANYCGASSNRVYIYNNSGQQSGYVKR